jgi:hypothetical protein
MSAARASRAQQLRTRLKATQAELREVQAGDQEDLVRQLAEAEQQYIKAVNHRKNLIKRVLSMEPGDRPTLRRMTEATGLSKARLYQIVKTD